MKILLVTPDSDQSTAARYGGRSDSLEQAGPGANRYQALVTLSKPPASYDCVVVETGNAVNNDDDELVARIEDEPAVRHRPEGPLAPRDSSVRRWRNDQGGLYELSVRKGPQGDAECVFEYHQPCQTKEVSRK